MLSLSFLSIPPGFSLLFLAPLTHLHTCLFSLPFSDVIKVSVAPAEEARRKEAEEEEEEQGAQAFVRTKKRKIGQ